MLGAACLVLALSAACHYVDVVERGEGGSSAQEPIPAKEPSRCAPFTDKESCCSAECLWLDPSGDFEGRCFDESENCGGRSDCFHGSAECCGAQRYCYMGDFLGRTAACKPQYGLGGSSYGVCVDECPVGPPHPLYQEACLPVGPQ